MNKNMNKKRYRKQAIFIISCALSEVKGMVIKMKVNAAFILLHQNLLVL